MAVTDLTGYTWIGKDSGYLDPGMQLDASVNINFTCNNVNYTKFEFKNTFDDLIDFELIYGDTKVYSFIVDNAWVDNSYKTIKIIDGDGVQEGSLINWLEANGTLIVPINKNLKIGSNSVDKLYIGLQEVDKIYMGSNLVYQK